MARHSWQSPVEGGRVGENLIGGFLECDKDTGLFSIPCRIDDGLQSKDCLARARPANNKARPVLW
jgi:hypothetical protein